MNIVVTTINAKYIHTCLALRLLKAYAEPDFQINIKEYTLKDPDLNIVQDLYTKKPDVIGFSCYIWNIEKTIQIVKMLKKVLPETSFILGGPEVSYDTDYWMERIPEADYIVRGEGEETFKHLLEAVKDQKSVKNIGSLAYRDNGQVVLTPAKPNLDITAIPTPYRFEADRIELNKRIVYFETSRGCPFQCQFCLSSIEVGVRYFDINKVKEELLYLIANGAKMIKFIDRTFNIKRDYALEIFQFLIDNHGGCQFQFEITADIMRPEVLEFLNENAPKGIFRFEIGVQSTNDETNLLVKRKQNFSKLARTVNLIKHGGKIDQHLDLIAGLPEEDYNSFKKTFNDVFALRPEELQLGFLKMLRGTGMRAMAKQYNYVFMDHAPYEILANNILSFDEVIRIKRVEDILEKYWNDHRLDHTVDYLTHITFNTPFDFFQEFGDYWDEHGWGKIGHQFEDLFVRLASFLKKRQVKDLSVIEGLMKIDYFLHFKQKPRKTWWTQGLTKDDLNLIRINNMHIDNKLEPYLNDVRTMSKHVIAEKLPFNYQHYTSTGEIKKEDGLLFAVYEPSKQKPFLHYIRASQEQKI
ncbi:B12-binding domain-containing radical SAM protein [Salipaludibacillus aurantiacus]|uniref:Anaerobic magnesium-protoporphyrin IX monomethyl ester cyclase n=1 Tax=Salipaludibacillus aurantiacus TaxID=1601833 RepID=A0A1H9TA43_9BACI|nr:B12-binding domain-containing radical SAM protein [Salipaludibacillus aurantiacus]SER93669.1 anaerobic magnesium-protoporphyrin IX monomethyl ester cyclase [Salipaludibacillus aurantiacus]